MRSALTATDSLEALGILGVIPVVVIDDAAAAMPLAETLMEAGLPGAEITLRTPAALPALRVLTGYDGFLAGVGSLLEPGQATWSPLASRWA
jgi:2-dehydro-3-deoxyphosphogluconate aldolase / (4S)-4-hydroxy-2-oxoglutarate aldolase